MTTLELSINVLSIGISTWVGAELWVRGRRARALPEQLLSVALLLGGGLGYALWVATFAIEAKDAYWAVLPFGSLVSIGAASACMFEFTRRVFRPASTWALGLSIGGISAIVLGTLGPVTDGWRYDDSSWLVTASFMAQQTAFAWAAIESFRLRRRTRRQALLGLIDSTVVYRFTMWGLFNVSMLIAGALSVIALLGLPAMLAALAHGLGVIFLWSAFHVPSPYMKKAGAPGAARSSSQK